MATEPLHWSKRRGWPYGGLSGRSPVGLPARFALPNGAVREIAAPRAAFLQEVAGAALASRP